MSLRSKLLFTIISATLSLSANANGLGSGLQNKIGYNTKQASRLNLNSADAKSIADAVKGIGRQRAKKIIAYRTENGPFKSVNELSKIKGISQETINKIRDNVTVG